MFSLERAESAARKAQQELARARCMLHGTEVRCYVLTVEVARLLAGVLAATTDAEWIEEAEKLVVARERQDAALALRDELRKLVGLYEQVVEVAENVAGLRESFGKI